MKNEIKKIHNEIHDILKNLMKKIGYLYNKSESNEEYNEFGYCTIYFNNDTNKICFSDWTGIIEYLEDLNTKDYSSETIQHIDEGIKEINKKITYLQQLHK